MISPFLGLLFLAIAPGAARAEGARYLIIAPREYTDELQPLADWKTRKGMLAKIASTEETGHSTGEIRAFVRDAYETWDPPPEYVLIGAGIGTISMAYEGHYPTDTSFASVDDDLFTELIVGRFPAESASQVVTMVNKTLQYERTPIVDDPFYYRSAAFLIYQDHDDDDICSYFGDAYWAAALMQQVGFTDVSVMSASTTSDIYNRFQDLLDAGLGWAGHHGVIGHNCSWPSYGVAPEDLHNGPMLPILVGFTCQTLGYQGCYGERWLQAGSPTELIGAVAYVGQAASCSYCAHWRSALRRGFWGYIFEDNGPDDIITFGEAVEAGRLRYYEEFRSSSQYYAATAYADPELNLWTDVPAAPAVSQPPIVPRGAVTFSVQVSREGVPRQGARVCVMSDQGTYAYDTTGADGVVEFSVDTSADEGLYLTVTGRNLVPFEGSIAVYEPGGGSVDTGEPPDDSEEPDQDTDQPPISVAPGGQCGCGGAGSLAPLSLLLTPLWLRRRARAARRSA